MKKIFFDCCTFQGKFRLSWTVRGALLYLLVLVVVSLFMLYSMLPVRQQEDIRITENVLLEPTPAISWKFQTSPDVTCKIPSLNPLDKAIVQTKLPPDNWKVNCKQHKIFSIDSDWNLIQHYGNKALECCYRHMKPHPEPKPSSYSNVFTYRHIDPTLLAWYSPTCFPLTSNVTGIPKNYEFISIECIAAKNFTKTPNNAEPDFRKIIFRDMFAFVPEKLLKNTTSTSKQTSSPAKLSILIIGLDQISHMQFIRHFPVTFQFLTKNMNAKGMFGYNKVDQTTLPNVATLLTGRSLDELAISCWNHSFLSFFDDCPFIWKNFSQNGFLTSYAEDKLPYSIFYNKLYARRGFRHQPTDYFYNFVGMQRFQMMENPTMCVNDRLEFQDLLTYIKDTARVLQNTPYFQFAWASSLFTKSYNYARNGDTPLYEALKYLQDTDLLKNTILILTSDHGYRFSPLIELRQGRFESKMPLLMTVFPKAFSLQYPTAISNFDQNSNKLTSPFDTFQTLVDLINPEITLAENIISLRKVKVDARGTSLFLPIPVNRTCEVAGIDPNYCICRDTKPLKYFDGSEVIKKFQVKIMNEINSYVRAYNVCSQLYLRDGFRSSVSVVMSDDLAAQNYSLAELNKKEYILLKENLPGHFLGAVRPRLKQLVTNVGNFSEVLMTVQTLPGLGKFEGRLKLMGRKWVVQDVLRLNEYNLQSHCVGLYKLKSFCYCIDQIVA